MGMLFGISRFGWFLPSMLLCQMNGTGGFFAIEDTTVKLLSFVCISVFVFVTGSSCWGGAICYDPNIPRDQAGSEMPPMALCARSLSEAAAFPFSHYTADGSDIHIHVFRCFIHLSFP
jgi:hypothetical protein